MQITEIEFKTEYRSYCISFLTLPSRVLVTGSKQKQRAGDNFVKILLTASFKELMGLLICLRDGSHVKKVIVLQSSVNHIS